jgi:hypothetical protein
MSYVRAFKKKLKDGIVQTYYGRVESYRDGEKVRQRMVEYLGVNPNKRTFPLDETLAGKVASIVASPRTPIEIMNLLKDQGFEVSFRPRQVQLINNPPLRHLSLRIE